MAWKPWWSLVQMVGKRSSGGMGYRASTHPWRRGEFFKDSFWLVFLMSAFSPFLLFLILKRNLLVMHSTFPWDKARWVKLLSFCTYSCLFLNRTKLTYPTNVFPLKTFAKGRLSLNDFCSKSPKTIHFSRLVHIFTCQLACIMCN